MSSMDRENANAMSDGSPVAQPLSLGELEGGTPAGTGPVVTAGALATPLRNVRVKLTVSLGAAELTVGDLLGAKAHQVLKLDTALEQPVDVLLDGQVVARGTLVAIDDRFGVRLTELPPPMDLAGTIPGKG